MGTAKKFSVLLFLVILITQIEATAQLPQCKAVLKNDTLTLENSKRRRTFFWNNGAPSKQLISGQVLTGKADLVLPGISAATENSSDYYMKGKASHWVSFVSEGESMKNIEDEKSLKSAGGKILFADSVSISGNHWKIKAVEFFDASDYNNSMVLEYTRLLYRRENRLRGNLLFVSNLLKKEQFFILKEAPVSGLIWGCIAGCFAIAGNIAVFYAFINGGQASIVIPVTNLYPLVTIVIAVPAFKERLNIVNLAGILLAIPAILLLSGETLLFTDPSAFFKGIGLNEWFMFSLAAIFCWGIFSAAQKVTTNHISAEWSYLAFVFTSILITVVFLFSGKIYFNLSTKTFLSGALARMLNGLGVLVSFAAYRAEGKAAAVTTIAGAVQPVFTIVLALLFLNERLSLMEFSGIVLAIGGALILSYEKKKVPVIAV